MVHNFDETKILTVADRREMEPVEAVCRTAAAYRRLIAAELEKRQFVEVGASFSYAQYPNHELHVQRKRDPLTTVLLFYLIRKQGPRCIVEPGVLARVQDLSDTGAGEGALREALPPLWRELDEVMRAATSP